MRIRVSRTARDTADAVLRTDELFLDGLGRLLTREEPAGTTIWTWGEEATTRRLPAGR